MEKISIEILGIILSEPMTFLTDLLLAIGCFGFFYSLQKQDIESKVNRYWKYFFLFMGISTLIGGVAHGFVNYIKPDIKIYSWITSGISILFAELASLNSITSNKRIKRIRPLIYIQFVLFLWLVIYNNTFLFVKYNTAIGLVAVVLLIETYAYYKHKDIGSSLIALGIVLTSFTALIHGFKFSFHEWFNYNDISHVIMLLCLYIIFLGTFKKSEVLLSNK